MTADRDGRDDGTFVIRPSWATYRAQRAGPWAVIPLTIAALLPLGRLGWFGLYLGIVVVAPAAYLLWRYFRCLRVEVGEAQIVYGGYLRTRRWSRAELARVLVVDDLNLSKLEVAHEWVIALDRAGRRMFQLTSAAWSDEDRGRLTRALDRTEHWPQGTTSAELHAWHPGALKFTQRRPVLAGLVISFVIIGVLALATYLVFEPS